MLTLRQHRAKHQWTQEELAEKAGTTQKTVSAIELGKTLPRARVSKALAGALGVDLQAILEVWLSIEHDLKAGAKN